MAQTKRRAKASGHAEESEGWEFQGRIIAASVYFRKAQGKFIMKGVWLCDWRRIGRNALMHDLRKALNGDA